MREMAFLRLYNFKIFRGNMASDPLAKTARTFSARYPDAPVVLILVPPYKKHLPTPLEYHSCCLVYVTPLVYNGVYSSLGERGVSEVKSTMVEGHLVVRWSLNVLCMALKSELIKSDGDECIVFVRWVDSHSRR